jgi:hypothetical protein
LHYYDFRFYDAPPVFYADDFMWLTKLSMLINKKEREKEEWKCRYTVVPCSEVTGINEKDNGFLGSGPISSHLLTARPRGRIYSPPGDHNHPLFTLLRPQAKVHKNTVPSSFTSHFSKDRFTSTQFALHIFLNTNSLQLFSTVYSHWEVVFKVWCIGGADKKGKDQ